MRTGLLAAGNWIVDHVKLIDSWPPQDGLVNILAQTRGNGGGPYNVLKALAKLGAPFPLTGLGLLGDDDNGRAIRADCAAHGIDATRLRTVPGAQPATPT
ncbi:MAG: PfkB family carbohydrate kinase [Opitutales bacterium]